MKDPFFDQVYQLVQHIPPGKVATYGQVARLLGQPRAARTVGWAMRAAPEGIDLPWQRVVNARGTVSFAPGSPGAVMQRGLLEEEGVVFDENNRIDLKVYGWEGLEPVEIEQLLRRDM